MSPFRDLKILFSALAGSFLLLVGITNLTDYQTNLAFVARVAGMEGLFSEEALRWRSLQSPCMHHALYVAIILWELACGSLAVMGAWRMYRTRRTESEVFEAAGATSIYAYGLSVTLWFGGFVAVAGEWFLMWRGESADTQGKALLFAIVFLLMLVFHVAAADKRDMQR